MSSTRLRAATLVLVLVTSCTNTFGLDPVSVDDDLDGVLDDADNCPQAFNPRQQDFDRDGIGDHCGVCASPSNRDDDGDGIDDACDACVGPGEVGLDVGGDGIDDGCESCPEATGQDLDADGVDDACDSCLRGPPLDEDGDGVANACDDCPSRPDPMQAQANDADRLGDLCDPDTDPLGASGMAVTQTHRLFDPFVGPPGSWAHLGASISDGLAHLPAGEYGQTNAKVSDQFLVETVVRFPTSAADASFEVRAEGFVTGGINCQLTPCNVAMTCTLTGDGQLVLQSFTNSTTPNMPNEVLDVSAPIRLWVRSSFSTLSPGGGLSQLCVGVDVHGTVVSLEEHEVTNAKAIVFTPSITARLHPVDVHYVWLVSN